MGEHMQAWCECSHCSSWHDNTGRCTYLDSRLDHTTQQNIDVPCECFELRIADAEVFTWPDECAQCKGRHRHVDAVSGLCGRCRVDVRGENQ